MSDSKVDRPTRPLQAQTRGAQPDPVFVWLDLSPKGVQCADWTVNECGQLCITVGTCDGTVLCIDWLTKQVHTVSVLLDAQPRANAQSITQPIMSMCMCANVLWLHERATAVHLFALQSELKHNQAVNQCPLKLTHKVTLPTDHYGFCTSISDFTCANALNLPDRTGTAHSPNVSIYTPNQKGDQCFVQKHSIDVQHCELNGSIDLHIDPSKQKRGSPMQILYVSSTGHLLIAFENGHLSLFDVHSSKQLTCTQVFKDPILAMDQSACGKQPNTLIGYCGSSCPIIKQYTLTYSDTVQPIEDTVVQTELSDSTVTQTDVTNQRSVKLSVVRELDLEVSTGVAKIAIRKSDCKLVAIGCWDYKVRLFSVKHHVKLAVIDCHLNTITALSFSEFSNFPKFLLIGCKDGKMSVYDLYTDK